MKREGDLEIVKLPIDSLTPYKRNAKKHPPEQVEQIKESIRLYGNNDPIAVWGKKNMIVEGHGRFLALKELGYTEAECVRLDHLTAQERAEYTLVHNQTTMNSGFDIPALKLELGELPNFKAADFGFDLNFSLPGYPESAPEDLEPYRPPQEAQEDRDGETVTVAGNNYAGNTGASPVPRETNFHYREQYAVTVMCKGEAEQKEIYERLTAEGFDCRVVCV